MFGVAKLTAEIPHLEARITFLPTSAGGRHGPVYSGYRPQFFYDGRDWDAVQNYPDVIRVNPGDSVLATITFLSPESHRGRIRKGMRFDVREGSRVVAHGCVTLILDDNLAAKDA